MKEAATFIRAAAASNPRGNSSLFLMERSKTKLVGRIPGRYNVELRRGGPRWSEESIKATIDTYLAPALIGSVGDRFEVARIRMDGAAKRTTMEAHPSQTQNSRIMHQKGSVEIKGFFGALMKCISRA
jgi:hypothetical protein